MKMRKLLTLGLLFLSLCVMAADPPPAPTPIPTRDPEQAFEPPPVFHLVNDHAGMLPPSFEIRLAQKLDALSQKNGTRIVVMTVPSTGKEDVSSYASRFFINAGLGEDQANGALFLINGANGHFYIIAGAGLGGVMPDIWIRQLIDKTITPLWTPDTFQKGLEAGVDAMIARAGGEETKPSTFGKLVFSQDWKILSWGSLLITLVIYAFSCVTWRVGLKRPWPAARTHAVVIGLLTLAAVSVALYPDPLRDLLASKGQIKEHADFQIPKLARQPLSLATLASPGHISVIAVTYEKLAKESSLERQLRDLARIRPDVAFRMAYLDFEGWNTGELRHLFGQDMAILPYFMIFGADGKLIKADQGSDQVAADLLDRWQVQESYREAGVIPE